MVTTITTTLGALVQAEPALARLLDLSLPRQTAYHLAKLARLASHEIAHFREQERAITKACGVEREATEAERPRFGPKVLQVPPECFAAYAQQMHELAAVSVEITCGPVSIDALGDQLVTGKDVLLLIASGLLHEPEPDVRAPLEPEFSLSK